MLTLEKYHNRSAVDDKDTHFYRFLPLLSIVRRPLVPSFPYVTLDRVKFRHPLQIPKLIK